MGLRYELGKRRLALARSAANDCAEVVATLPLDEEVSSGAANSVWSAEPLRADSPR